MNLISGIANSGIFAQSAYSAGNATNDGLGRNISETYLTCIPDEYATKDYVDSGLSDKYDTSSFSAISADFLIRSGLEYENGLITGYDGSAFKDTRYSAGDNIVIANDTISVNSSIALMHPNTLRTMNLDGNEAQFVDISGDAGCIVDPSGVYVSDLNQTEFAFIDKNQVNIRDASGLVSIENTGRGPSVYLERDSGNTPISTVQMYAQDHALQRYRSYIELTDHDSATSSHSQLDLNTVDVTLTHVSDDNDPALYRRYSLTGACNSAQSALNILNSSDLTYYSAGDFIDITDHVISVTGVDPTQYQEKTGMTAYQSAGDYYSASNPSGFISEIPDTYLQNTDLTITDGKITEISGVPLASANLNIVNLVKNISGDTADFVSGINNIPLMASRMNVGAYQFGSAIDGSSGMLVLSPKKAIFRTAELPSALSPLQYATGAGMTVSAGNYRGFFKGNEIFISNTIGQNASTFDVNLSNSKNRLHGTYTTQGEYNLEPSCVSGKTGTKTWRYGTAEDAALRNVSSCDMYTSAFEYDSDSAITAYNGSAFAGGDLPQSAIEAIDAVTANSAQWAQSGTEYSATAPLYIDNDNIGISAKDFNLTAPLVMTEDDSAVNITVSAKDFNLTAPLVMTEDESAVNITVSSKDMEVAAPLYLTEDNNAVTLGISGILYESGFGYDSNSAISGYNGSAFAGGGGGDIPQSAYDAINVVTSNSGEWNETYDTVSANSGAWGGSALPISAGAGMSFSLVDDTLVINNTASTLPQSAINAVNVVTGSSGNWNNTYSAVTANSAIWSSGNYSGASGINVSNEIISLDNPIGIVAGDGIAIEVSGDSATISNSAICNTVPDSTGTYILKCIDGVIQWVLEA